MVAKTSGTCTETADYMARGILWSGEPRRTFGVQVNAATRGVALFLVRGDQHGNVEAIHERHYNNAGEPQRRAIIEEAHDHLPS